MKNKLHGKSVNIRIATKSDIPSLAHLYTACFGDDEAETEDFLHAFFQAPDFMILAAASENTIVSMISMIPARLAKSSGGFYRAYYLYGIGTLPPYRKQGLSGLLMDRVKTLASLLGYDLLFLVPASKDLTYFYEKQGFRTMFPAKQTKSPCFSPDSADLIPISLEIYLSLRTSLEAVPGVFSLSEPFRSYALEIVKEQLYFYKKPRPAKKQNEALNTPDVGLCFYGSKKKPSLHFLEQTAFPAISGQTASQSVLAGGLVHQIFALNPVSLPESTYFQFPMDEIFR